MMRSQRFEKAKAMALPPAPAKMSTMVFLAGELIVLRSSAMRTATGSGVTPNQASSVRRMSSS
jgi:hypothetical protein